MSFTTYTKYKPSGIDWAQQIPVYWTCTRLKYTARPGNKTFVDGDWIESPYITEDGIRLLQCGNIGTGKFEEQGFRFISEDTFQKLGCTEVEPNNVLICRLQSSKTILAGRACIAPFLGSKMITSVDNCILKLSEDFDSRYIVYQLSTPAYLSFVEVIARGGTRDRISRSMLGEIPIISPPRNEQKKIADFLGRETSKIDALIEEQQKLIELLKEKRQAVISHAVTKGLNPNAAMKSSGIEWLGDIPSGWSISRLGFYCSKIGSGKTPSGGAEAYSDQGITFIRSQNVHDDGLNLVDVVYISNEIDEELATSRVLEGDILLNITGASLGRTCMVGANIGPANVNQHVCIIRIENESIRSFVAVLLKSNWLRSQIDIAQTGAGREGLNFWQISKLQITVPPPHEADAISQFIDDLNKSFDALMKESEHAISILHERRSSLISAAVTGKIDVRNLAQ